MPASNQIRRILVPVDFSEHSRIALRFATSLARQLDAKLVLLHVWEPPQYVSPDIMLSVPGWSAMSLEAFSHAEALSAVDVFLEGADIGAPPPEVRIETGDPAASIVRVANGGDYDMVVMGTQGRAGISRFLLGSVAMKVSGRATIPVLTLRASPPTKEKMLPRAA